MTTNSRPCPCGCGEILRPYNGQRRLVCSWIWQRVPHQDRAAIMLPGHSAAEWRAAARRVLRRAWLWKRTGLPVAARI